MVIVEPLYIFPLPEWLKSSRRCTYEWIFVDIAAYYYYRICFPNFIRISLVVKWLSPLTLNQVSTVWIQAREYLYHFCFDTTSWMLLVLDSHPTGLHDVILLVHSTLYCTRMYTSFTILMYYSLDRYLGLHIASPVFCMYTDSASVSSSTTQALVHWYLSFLKLTYYV